MKKTFVFYFFLLFLLLNTNYVIAASDFFSYNNQFDSFGYNKINNIVSDFLDLDDTPSIYSGNQSNCVVVNSAGTGLTFTNCSASSGITNFLYNQTTEQSCTFLLLEVRGF